MFKMKSTLPAIAALFLWGGAVQAQESLRIGLTYEPYMPYTQGNAAGEWEGFEADLTRALCERMPVECIFEPMAWDGLMPSLLGGKVDTIIAALSITEERLKTVSFSDPYYVDGSSIVGLKEDGREIAIIDAADGSGKTIDPESMKGAIIGAQTASIQLYYLQQHLPNIEIKTYEAADSAMADLVAGRVDYVMAVDSYMRNFLKSEGIETHGVRVPSLENRLLGGDKAYAIRLDDTRTLELINTALRSMEADGSLSTLVDQWMNF